MDNNKNDKTISIRLTDEEYDELLKHATANSQKISKYVKNAIVASYNESIREHLYDANKAQKHADALRQMLAIKQIIVTNRNRITDSVIQDTERRLANVCLTLR